MIEFTFVRNPYNYNAMDESDRTGLKCEDKSKTQQHQKEESDINTIVRKFGLTGQLPTNVKAPQFGDFTEVTDYQTALNAVIAAEHSFMQMPANIRSRFHNDPQEFVEFCSNPENVDEAVKLGLVVKREAPAPEQAQPAPGSGPAATAAT